MSSVGRVEPVSLYSSDWAKLLPDTDHARFFVTRNWSETLLGLLDTWTVELRLYVLQAFADLRPACLYWGSSKVAIYNEAFLLLAGKTHPALMGARFQDIFPEIVDVITPFFDEAGRTRRAVPVMEMTLTIERNHFTEDAIFEGSFIPIVLLDGTVGGFYNAVQEVTKQKLTDRRTVMLNLISASAFQLTSNNVYTHILKCLETNKLDIPFALLYKIQIESKDGNHTLDLLDSVGFPWADKYKSQRVKLHENVSFTPLLREAQSQIVTRSFRSACEDMDWDSMQWDVDGKSPRYITTLPLSSAGRAYGFLIVGNNPRRPIDDQHDQFMSDLQRHATSAITATISIEEANVRNEKLQSQLLENERQIRYMAQHSDIGMLQLTLQGTLIWANEHYYSFVTHEDADVVSQRETFLMEQDILEGDRTSARKAWQQVILGQKAETTELRLEHRYCPPSGPTVPATILLSAFPYLDNGQVTSIMACMTEVSRLKWAESWQAQMAHDAKEARRQQSEFTDAISHEIRNPLSAMLQLADSILTSSNAPEALTLEEAVNRTHEHGEAARSIINCARHQKRIVDDVLRLSRMNFSSIVLSPSPAYPKDLVQEAIEIMRAEVTANSISLKLTTEPSMSQLVPDQVMCDSLRITQILVNLLSNAIKFTKHEATRAIDIRFGAATSDVRDTFSSRVTWAPQRQLSDDATQHPEWGKGKPLFLTFVVEDTGPGMTSESLGRVFDRFEQATPRTHIKYGGSGLGLFICHNLIERQSGEIGVYSTPGSGSTFVFYVKVRRVETTRVRVKSDRKEDVQAPKGEIQASLAPNTIPQPNIVSETPKLSHSGHFHLLLVEDNIINQRILQKQLVKAGCTVHVANHGLEALEFLRNSSNLWLENKTKGSRLDAILMDWEMPIMDGLTCTREIRRLESTGHFASHPEIIAITANVRQEQIDAATEAGVDTVLPKPFLVSDLLEVVAKRVESSSPTS